MFTRQTPVWNVISTVCSDCKPVWAVWLTPALDKQAEYLRASRSDKKHNCWLEACHAGLSLTQPGGRTERKLDRGHRVWERCFKSRLPLLVSKARVGLKRRITLTFRIISASLYSFNWCHFPLYCLMRQRFINDIYILHGSWHRVSLWVTF